MLQVVRRDHDLPLAVVDRTGRQLAVAGADLDAEQLREVARALARRPPPLELELDGVTVSLFLVAAVGDVDAALVCLRPYRELSPAELDSLQQACNYLSLEVAKQQAVHAIEQRFAGEVLDMVQAGPHREGDVAQRLRAFGVDPTGQIAVLAVAVADAPADESVDMTEAITGFLVDRSLAALVAAGTRETIALVSWPQSLGRSLRYAGRGSAARTSTAALTMPASSSASGASATGPAGLRDVLVQARETCRAMQHQRGGPEIQAFSDLNNHRLLLGMLGDDTLVPVLRRRSRCPPGARPPARRRPGTDAAGLPRARWQLRRDRRPTSTCTSTRCASDSRRSPSSPDATRGVPTTGSTWSWRSRPTRFASEAQSG